MAISSSQLQQYLKDAFPTDLSSMLVTGVMVPSGRVLYVDEIVGYGESGPMYGARAEPEMVVGGYYSPALGRQLTAEESRYLIPIKENIEGQGQVTSGLVFPGQKGIDAINALGLDPSRMSGQSLPQGLEIYPTGAIPTDEGGRTNIALRYGSSGGPEAYSYQSGTLTGSVGLDKIVDTLAKAANTALLTSVGGMALGPAGAGLLGKVGAGAVAGSLLPAIQGGDTQDIVRGALGGAVSGYLQPAPIVESAATSFGAGMPFDEVITAAQAAELAAPGLASTISPEVAASNLGLLESSMGTYVPPVVMEPVLEPSTALTGTLAQPPITVEDIAGRLTPEAQGLMNVGAPSLTPPPLINEPVLVPESALTGTLAETPPAVEDIAGRLTPEATQMMNLQDVFGPQFAAYQEQVAKQLADAQQNYLSQVGGLQSQVGSLEDIFNKQYADYQEQAAKSLAESQSAQQRLADLAQQFGEGFTQYQEQAGKDLAASQTALAGTLGTTFAKSMQDLAKQLMAGQQQTAQQTSTGSLLGPALGALLSRQPTAAPQAPVSAGRAVDIVSPIASLLAPKMVQRQPISLL